MECEKIIDILSGYEGKLPCEERKAVEESRKKLMNMEDVEALPLIKALSKYQNCEGESVTDFISEAISEKLGRDKELAGELLFGYWGAICLVSDEPSKNKS